MKKNEVIASYNALLGCKLTKMGGESRMKVVKIVTAMKPVFTAYNDFAQETVKRLKPEWMDDAKEREWASNGERSQSLTATEKAEARQFYADADKGLKEELEKDVTLDYPKLTDDEFKQFAESNDFTTGQLIELMNVLQ